MVMNLVLVETDGGVCTITLNRPEARNALNTALHRASADALWAAEVDDTIAAVVLTAPTRRSAPASTCASSAAAVRTCAEDRATGTRPTTRSRRSGR